jgi:hypothetical protein
MLTAIAMAVVSRIEGGFWMGEGPTRSDSAVHSVLELLQPALLVALAGALGVVVGRATHHTILVIIVGVLVWMVLFPFYWVWNAPLLHVVTPIQSMPLWVELADVRSMSDLPADWYVEYPSEFEPHYRRALVHLPTVAFHHVYLVGLIMVVAASVWRERRRTARRAGIVLAIAGVAAQLAVSPF